MSRTPKLSLALCLAIAGLLIYGVASARQEPPHAGHFSVAPENASQAAVDNSEQVPPPLIASVVVCETAAVGSGSLQMHIVGGRVCPYADVALLVDIDTLDAANTMKFVPLRADAQGKFRAYVPIMRTEVPKDKNYRVIVRSNNLLSYTQPTAVPEKVLHVTELGPIEKVTEEDFKKYYSKPRQTRVEYMSSRGVASVKLAKHNNGAFYSVSVVGNGALAGECVIVAYDTDSSATAPHEWVAVLVEAETGIGGGLFQARLQLSTLPADPSHGVAHAYSLFETSQKALENPTSPYIIPPGTGMMAPADYVEDSEMRPCFGVFAHY